MNALVATVSGYQPKEKLGPQSVWDWQICKELSGQNKKKKILAKIVLSRLEKYLDEDSIKSYHAGSIVEL